MKTNILVSLFFLCFFGLSSQVTLTVEKIPESTPPGDFIYVAGSMNDWDPGNEAYRFIQNEDSLFTVTFTPPVGTFKFKFTRGSWSTVEGTSKGKFRPDRVAEYKGKPITFNLYIDGWEGVSLQSTASQNVSVLSDTFYMPELNTHRRIWLYLPEDYHTSDKRYQVLYMHDGQNLFDKYTSFAGEWGVDEAMDSLVALGHNGCIIVGVENGGNQRIYEYTPWTNPRYGGGGGDVYIQFLKNTLKPYIDTHYRTMSEPENTGIMGSSLGGLISFYAGLTYPETFGRVGAFSPSFWFSSRSFDLARTALPDIETYIYMMAGGKEGQGFVKDMYDMGLVLYQTGLSDHQIFTTHHKDGEHNEWYWRREFPHAFKWLFEKKTPPDEVDTHAIVPRISYSQGQLYIHHIPEEGCRWYINNIYGQKVHEGFSAHSGDMPAISFPPSAYVYRIGNGDKYWLGVFVVSH